MEASQSIFIECFFLTYVNLISNVIVFFSTIAFILFVYGKKNSKLNSISFIEKTVMRIGLLTICFGCLFSFMEHTTPPLSELIVKLGLAIVFLWGAVFHFIHLKK